MPPSPRRLAPRVLSDGLQAEHIPSPSSQESVRASLAGSGGQRVLVHAMARPRVSPPVGRRGTVRWLRGYVGLLPF